MALTGNLRDFDLSYIFQIVAQEGKTGQLRMNGDWGEAFVVFDKGRIISAGTGKKTLKKALLIYLVDAKGAPYNTIKRLSDQLKDNLKALADHIVHAKFVSTPELSRFTETMLEDLSCSLFLWKEGDYSFEVYEDVSKFRINDVALPPEAITMEAARRLDEWERMQPKIKPASVYVLAQNSQPNPIDTQADPLEDPSDYICTFLDGTTSVDYICKRSFLSEFRVYETLQELLNQERIVALSEKLSTSINEALRRRVRRRKFNLSDIGISSAIAVLIVLLVLVISAMVPNSLFRNEKRIARQLQNETFKRASSEKKTAIFTLYHIAARGHEPLKPEVLSSEGLLAPRDITDVSRKPSDIDIISLP